MIQRNLQFFFWVDGNHGTKPFSSFERAIAKTGQVVIQVRDVKDSSGGKGQEDNPFSFEQISEDIAKKLKKSGYLINDDYIIQLVPNITIFHTEEVWDIK